MEESEDVTPMSKEEIDEIINREWQKAGLFSPDDIQTEGRHVFASFSLPAGGIFRGGERYDSVVITETDGNRDSVLMNTDMKKIDAVKQFAVATVKSVGPLDSAADINRAVREELLLGDYIFLLFKIRQLSLGNKIPFRAQCGRQACLAINNYSIKISEMDFEIPKGFDPYDLSSRSRVMEVDRHGAIWKLHWHFMTEGDSTYLRQVYEREIAKNRNEGPTGEAHSRRDQRASEAQPRDDARFIMKGGDADVDYLTASLLPRVDVVEEPGGKRVVLGRGRGDEVELSSEASLDYIRGLPSAVRLGLYNEADRYEPALDTDAVYECMECGAENRQVIFPADPSFFTPSEILPD